VKLAPNRYLYWANLADAYRWSPGQKSKAAEAYGRAIGIVRDELAKKPEDPDLESRLALYLAKSGDKGAALDALQRVERLAPTQAVMLFRIAVAYEVCAMRDKALTALEKAMKAGYAEKEVRGEPELLSLRNDLRFHKIVASLAAPDRPSK
jgi:tetratricopeptide (TPR) repeat protein